MPRIILAIQLQTLHRNPYPPNAKVVNKLNYVWVGRRTLQSMALQSSQAEMNDYEIE